MNNDDTRSLQDESELPDQLAAESREPRQDAPGSPVRGDDVHEYPRGVVYENEALSREQIHLQIGGSGHFWGSPAEPLPAERDVTRIMLRVVPGLDGMGHEVYAKSVDDVVELLNSLWDRIDGLELAAAREPTPIDVVLYCKDDQT